MRIRKILSIGITACFSLLAATGFCQPVQTITDRNDILIGEQVKLKIKATLPPAFNGAMQWISLPDSIPHFEIVDAGKADTVSYKDNSRAIEQTIILTSFDSGKWVFPALPFSLSQSQAYTDSFTVNVSYSPPDSTNQLRDIKPIINVSVTDYTWYYIIGAAVLLLLIVFLLYRYFKKNKKEKPVIARSKLSAYEEAMAEINKLGQFDLQDAAGIKIYHSKLGVIFKQYLGRKQQKNLLTKTTGDLLIRMAESGMPAGDVSNLATALRCTDAVKFAKYLPGIMESEDCLQKIKSAIDLTEHQTSNLKPQTSNFKPLIHFAFQLF